MLTPLLTDDPVEAHRRLPYAAPQPTSRSEVAPELRSVYDKFLEDRGNVPYLFRTLAHRPKIFRTVTAHMQAVLNTGTLPTKLKELVVVRASQLNCTSYAADGAHAASYRGRTR